jgi:hypothetical protein
MTRIFAGSAGIRGHSTLIGISPPEDDQGENEQ